MYFLIGNDDLLEKHGSILDKVIADVKTKFDNTTVLNKELKKAKVKSHGD